MLFCCPVEEKYGGLGLDSLFDVVASKDGSRKRILHRPGLPDPLRYRGYLVKSFGKRGGKGVTGGEGW